MKRRMLIGASALVLAVAQSAAAQGTSAAEISGRVTTQDGSEPIPEAQIVIVGTARGTRTGADGGYRIVNVQAGQVQVRAMRIGYAAQTRTVTVALGDRVTADFALVPTATTLDVVTATATGETQRKRENGTNVATIAVDSVAKASVQTFAQLVNGRAAGVYVLQSTGTTGMGARIRIRGANSVSLSNEPLYIIDGVRMGNDPNSSSIAVGGQLPSRINDLNTEDIETLEVIKGPAAAALYGTAAANGVVQIKTKQGRAGPARWTVYSEGGLVRENNDYPPNWGGWGDFGDGSEFFCDRITALFGDCVQDSVATFNPLEVNSPFRKGWRSKFGVSAAGGGERVTYFVSGDLEREEGIYLTSALRRGSVRANLRAELSDRADLQVNAGYVSSDLRIPQNDNNFLGYISNGLAGKALPEPERGRDGGYDPIGPNEIDRIRNIQEIERFTGGVTGTLRPLSWLALTGNGGLDLISRFDNETFARGAVDFSDLPEGSREANRIQTYNYTGNFAATASFIVRPELSSTTSAGFQFQREMNTGVFAQGAILAAGVSSLEGLASRFDIGEDYADNRTIGAFVQQQVGWRDRLFVTGAIRGDDNSAFGKSSEFVYYPSVNVSWVVGEEEFFPRTEWVNALRLRAAYGRSGLRPGNRDARIFFTPFAVRRNANEQTGVTIGGLGVPTLKPEIITEYEAGLDAGFLKDRLGVEVTYYDKKSKDALILRRTPASVGAIVSRFENLGSVSNKGWEWLLNGTIVDLPNVRWTAALQGSTNRNRLVSFGDTSIAPVVFGFEASQQHKPGYPLGGYWGIPIDSIVDQDDDGQIFFDEVYFGEEEQFLGSSTPTRTGSLSSDVTLFNVVKISGLLDWRGGYKLVNSSEIFREQVFIGRGVNDPTAPLDQQGRAVAAALFNVYTGYVEDASFMKLREIAVTLFAPRSLAQRAGVRDLSLTLAGRNLGTWTDYSGLDPEVNSAAQANFTSGDFLSQPQVRHWVARLNLTF
jgi:TonB-linked SusC/RagA family outer membrane protein